MDSRDDRHIPGSDARDQVGLGRVVEDRRSVGSPDAGDPDDGDPGVPVDRPRTDAARVRRDDPLVEEASEDSFPASDPPTFMSDAATPGDSQRTRLPATDDVP